MTGLGEALNIVYNIITINPQPLQTVLRVFTTVWSTGFLSHKNVCTGTDLKGLPTTLFIPLSSVFTHINEEEQKCKLI